MRVSDVLFLAIALFSFATTAARANERQKIRTKAEVIVTDHVIRPADKIHPIGVNGWGGQGAIQWAANNFIKNPGNEPIWYRDLLRAKKQGGNWFETDGGGSSYYSLVSSGFLSGANVRIYRIVDSKGGALPIKNGNLDMTAADHVIKVGESHVIAEGEPGFPDGGWIANKYTSPYPLAYVRNTEHTFSDTTPIERGRSFWYAVVAVDKCGKESALSNEVEVKPGVTPSSNIAILPAGTDDKLPEVQVGKETTFHPGSCGGIPPFKWSIKGTLPPGLKIDPDSGKLSGAAKAFLSYKQITLKVSDAKGHTGVRTLSPAAPTVTCEKPKVGTILPVAINPPSELKAESLTGCTTFTFKPSQSEGVVAYKIYRSSAQASQQMSRIYLAKGTPQLKDWDYIAVEKKFLNFDLKYLNPRVRGMGNKNGSAGWYWQADKPGLSFSLDLHTQSIPSAMGDAGESALKVSAAEGPNGIEQLVFIGTANKKEALWYGQLEPGAKYRLSVLLRQENLQDNGRVTFSFGPAYKGITNTFIVTKKWQNFSFEFTGPPRPTKQLHFGPKFTFTGPGTLWLDNASISNLAPLNDQKVLTELVYSQPAHGEKGTHRIWFLDRAATLSSLLHESASSKLNPDWNASISSSVSMTIPSALNFDLLTGDAPHTRMKPWLVLQHILNSESDWQNLIEYLAAPFDPKTDTAKKRPWAALRYKQRGVPTPWIDEFENIFIEFGNETWHNSKFPDFIGFQEWGAIHQGSRQYGLFACYLIDVMKQTEWWKKRNLDNKIHFILGGNYTASVNVNGKISGYAEQAAELCPKVSALGHANYVGPKWETGEKGFATYDDHGIQATLLGFIAGPEKNQRTMSAAKDALARKGIDVDFVAYEGGPGGYALPKGKADSDTDRIAEKYGKSQAMAIAAADAWFKSFELGWTYQNFFEYGQGEKWNSHTPLSEGFRGTPSWLAMTMLNAGVAGDMVEVQSLNLPEIHWNQKDYSLIGAYAFSEATKLKIAILSRTIAGKHDGADFVDGYIPLEISLPINTARTITLSRLTGDPHITNIEAPWAKIETLSIPTKFLRDGKLVINKNTGGGDKGIPPSSLFVYEIERERN